MQTFLRQRKEALDFEDISDPRDPRGQRWSLKALLSTAVFSMMVMTRSLRGAERFSEDLATGQRRLGIKRRVPDSTLGELLSQLNPKELRRHLHQQVLAEHRRKALAPTVVPIRAISIDGKTVATLDEEANDDCQKQNPENGPPHWLYRVVRATLISSTAAMCIDQKPIPAETNDMGVFKAFFAELMKTYGRADLFDLVFADAGFCSEANARQVDKAGKAYVLSLKSNQPDLQREAWRILGNKAKDCPPEAETEWECDSSRGWIKRQFWRTSEIAGFGGWPHLRQAWLVRVLVRDRQRGTQKVLEDRLYVTNLVPGRLIPEDALALVRAHWRIENNCFGRLDIEWQEDRGLWVRRKNGLAVTSLLRLIGYNLVEILRAVHLHSEQARRAAWQQMRDWIAHALIWTLPPSADQDPVDGLPALP